MIHRTARSSDSSLHLLDPHVLGAGVGVAALPGQGGLDLGLSRSGLSRR